MSLLHKKIDRYNDDFYFKFGNGKAVTNTTLSTLNNTDFSISFFVTLDNSGTYTILDNRSDLTGSDGMNIFSYSFGTTLNVLRVRIADQINNYQIASGVNNGTINNFTFNYDNTTKGLTLYLNDAKKETFTYNTVNFISDLFIGSPHFTSPDPVPFYLNGGLRDLCFYNKQLSEDEISYIYKTGVPPVSAYSNIQHYYPLNEIPTETGGNYFMSDKAESFNSSATNSEVEVIGWTADELGISNPSRLSSFKDFYTKNQYYGVGIKYDGSQPRDYRGNLPSLNTATNIPTFNDGFTIVFKIFMPELGINGHVLTSNNSNLEGIITVNENNNALTIFGASGINLFIGKRTGRPTTMALKFDASTNRFKSYQDGILYMDEIITPFTYSVTNQLRFGSALSNRQLKSFYYIGMYDGVLTDVDMVEKSKSEDWLSLSPTFFYSSENNGTQYIDQSGNLGNANIDNSVNFQLNQKYSNLGGVTYNNYQKGLNFDSSKQQYLEVTGLETFDNTKGWTIITGFNNLTTSSRNFVSFGDGLTYDASNPRISYFGSNVGGTHRQVNGGHNTITVPIDPLPENMVCYRFSNNRTPYYDGAKDRVLVKNGIVSRSTDVNYTADNTNGNGGHVVVCRWGNTYTSLRMSFLSVVRGIITDEEYKKIYNNGIYRSPYEVLQDTSKIILDVDFQNPFVDGTDIKFTDNSGNCEVIAKQNSGTDWSTLTGVENSID